MFKYDYTDPNIDRPTQYLLLDFPQQTGWSSELDQQILMLLHLSFKLSDYQYTLIGLLARPYRKLKVYILHLTMSEIYSIQN